MTPIVGREGLSAPAAVGTYKSPASKSLASLAGGSSATLLPLSHGIASSMPGAMATPNSQGSSKSTAGPPSIMSMKTAPAMPVNAIVFGEALSAWRD